MPKVALVLFLALLVAGGGFVAWLAIDPPHPELSMTQQTLPDARFPR